MYPYIPRLVDDAKRSKCPYCQFYDKCINQDSETDEAREIAKEIDLLDISAYLLNLYFYKRHVFMSLNKDYYNLEGYRGICTTIPEIVIVSTILLF